MMVRVVVGAARRGTVYGSQRTQSFESVLHLFGGGVVMQEFRLLSVELDHERARERRCGGGPHHLYGNDFTAVQLADIGVASNSSQPRSVHLQEPRVAERQWESDAPSVTTHCGRSCCTSYTHTDTPEFLRARG